MAEKWIYRSEDEGETWLLVSKYEFIPRTPATVAPDVGEAPSGVPGDLLFLDADTGFITSGGAGPAVYRTWDGGVSWTPAYGIPPGRGIDRIAFFDRERGIILAHDFDNPPLEFKTDDGGVTWWGPR